MAMVCLLPAHLRVYFTNHYLLIIRVGLSCFYHEKGRVIVRHFLLSELSFTAFSMYI